MVCLSSPPKLSDDALAVFHANDHFLSNAPILIFYGPSTPSAAHAAHSSSRVQSHVFTPAGFQSYPRLAISPSSPTYAAVNCLSREEQGDETCRALAYSVFKYFSELPESVKHGWKQRTSSAGKPLTAFELFSEAHAAELASRMTQLANGLEIAKDIENALGPETISELDLDVILPPGSIRNESRGGNSEGPNLNEDEATYDRYGQFAPLVKLFGEPMFMPTSKVKRAPSRPTAVNRSTTFSRAQKENIRRELCELVDTEENYVSKLDGLVNGIARDVRARSEGGSSSSSVQSNGSVHKIFPPSLSRILKMNVGFMTALRAVLEETEADAIDDITSTSAERPSSQPSQNDSTGASTVAACMLDWFPKFAGCYGEYISANSEVGQTLRTLMAVEASLVAQAIQEIGEQRLMSLLIEPIQRLPRYSLYIENITRQLPVQHQALKLLMKAKDLVTDICAQDQGRGDQRKILALLRRLVASWPQDCNPQTRLITAVDLIQSRPPFRLNELPHEHAQFVGLLFADCFVLAQKRTSDSLSARGLLSALEAPSFEVNTNESGRILFVSHFSLDEFDVLEILESRAIKLVPTRARERRNTDISDSNSPAKAISVFRLAGSYESRASRVVADFARARIEGRHSETERSGPKWEARHSDGSRFGLGISIAIFEGGAIGQDTKKRVRAGARIFVQNGGSGNSLNFPKAEGNEIVASVFVEGDGFFKLEVATTYQPKTRDTVTSAEFVPVLLKRLCNSLQMRCSMRNPILIAHLLQHNESILHALSLPVERRARSQSKTQSLRQHSPVKTLSKLFGGTSLRDIAEPRQLPPASDLFNNAPTLRPTLRPKAFSQSQLDRRDQQPPSQVALVSDNEFPSSAGTIEGLEQTFGNYVLALHARKGNVVGRSVSGRLHSNEATVNELYNALLEHPTNHEYPAQAPVDVLFASFEKFLKNAWQERMGSVLTRELLSELQNKSETASPIDFEDVLLKVLSEMAPQNRRAFRGILALVVDLLDGMSNDGDRGALMVAVTEILVPCESFHDFIPLFDRLIEEHDIILRNESRSGAVTPLPGSMASSNAGRSTNTGSFSSKASSFSKRLGFGSLQKDNGSKTDSSSRAGSIMRTWSKASRVPDSQPKAPLNRTYSTDFQSLVSSASRPTSRDKDLVSGVFEELRDGSRPRSVSRPGTGRSWDQLDSVKESDISAHSSPQRKKRRSSLSDISGLPLPNTSPFWGTPTFRRTEESPLTTRAGPNAQLSTPITPSSSPLRSNAIRHRPLPKKENAAPTVSNIHATADRPGGSENASGSPPSNPFSTGPLPLSSRTNLPQPQRNPSALPAPKSVLSERPASGNTPPPPAQELQSPQDLSTMTSSRKPRSQNPQKFRDRLQTQQAAIQGAETSLQNELAKIGEELAGLKGASPTRSNTTSSAPTYGSPGKRDPHQQILVVQNLGTRLKALETRMQHLMGNLSRHNAEMEKELLEKVRAGEKRARELDARLKEANAENDLLYARNNEELSRLFQSVGGGGGGGGGGGAEELKRKLAEALDEGATWKREVGKLRRENAVLKGKVAE